MSLLGDYYDLENESLEFKDFYLKIDPDIILSDKEISNIIKDGIWNGKLNKLIDINLKRYIRTYLPKYTSCFMNSKINGKLVFGVDDYGEITGIPYKGSIDEKIIYEYVIKTLTKYTKGLTQFNDISVNIKKLNIDIEILDDIVEEQILEMNNKLNQFKLNYQEYKAKRKIWIKELSKYSTKFFNILNTTESRKSVIKFCKDNGANQKIIDELELFQEIKVELNPDLYKKFRDKEELLYWAGRYKDENIEKLKLIKPAKCEKPKFINNNLILKKISGMRYRFLKNNDINYYIINIIINGQNSQQSVEFRYDSSENWYSRNRIILPTGPSCI